MSSSLKTEPISDLIAGGGLLVQPVDPGEQLLAVDHETIVELFEQHGVLLFRGFGIAPDDLLAVTDSFTETYAPDAVRRPKRFGKKQIRDVERGDADIPLHSEAAFAPIWPEIIWFYCVVPATVGGSTTICDGVMLWKKLSPQTKRLFLAQPVRYHYLSELGEEKVPGRGREPWPFHTLGVEGYRDRENGIADLYVSRFAVQESRSRMLCFANHAFTDFLDLTTTMSDGTTIPSETVLEIREAAEQLIYEIQWQPGDLVMLDNKRFLHGRRAFDSSQSSRDIVQIQSARASFAFGATMRTAIKRAGRQ